MFTKGINFISFQKYNKLIAILFIVIQIGPPLWSSGQSSWLQIQRPWFESHRYQIFWEVVGLERGPLSLASELYRPSDRRLSAKLVPTFEDRGCRVVSATDPHCRIVGFLDRSRYFFFQVAPQLYSRGWVDPVPDPLLLRKSGSAGFEPGPLDLKPGTLTTRPQRRSYYYYYYIYLVLSVLGIKISLKFSEAWN
jgi:hypothetical protein